MQWRTSLTPKGNPAKHLFGWPGRQHTPVSASLLERRPRDTKGPRARSPGSQHGVLTPPAAHSSPGLPAHSTAWRGFVQLQLRSAGLMWSQAQPPPPPSHPYSRTFLASMPNRKTRMTSSSRRKTSHALSARASSSSLCRSRAASHACVAYAVSFSLRQHR